MECHQWRQGWNRKFHPICGGLVFDLSCLMLLKLLLMLKLVQSKRWEKEPWEDCDEEWGIRSGATLEVVETLLR